jgi:hypothetical protein
LFTPQKPKATRLGERRAIRQDAKPFSKNCNILMEIRQFLPSIPRLSLLVLDEKLLILFKVKLADRQGVGVVQKPLTPPLSPSDGEREY